MTTEGDDLGRELEVLRREVSSLTIERDGLMHQLREAKERVENVLAWLRIIIESGGTRP